MTNETIEFQNLQKSVFIQSLKKFTKSQNKNGVSGVISYHSLCPPPPKEEQLHLLPVWSSPSSSTTSRQKLTWSHSIAHFMHLAIRSKFPSLFSHTNCTCALDTHTYMRYYISRSACLKIGGHAPVYWFRDYRHPYIVVVRCRGLYINCQDRKGCSESCI